MENTNNFNHKWSNNSLILTQASFATFVFSNLFMTSKYNTFGIVCSFGLLVVSYLIDIKYTR